MDLKLQSFSEAGLIFILIVFVVCYKSTINKLVGSNCIELDCFCCRILRKPLSEEHAMEMLTHHTGTGIRALDTATGVNVIMEEP